MADYEGGQKCDLPGGGGKGEGQAAGYMALTTENGEGKIVFKGCVK